MATPESPSDWRTYAADLFEHREPVLERLARRNPSVDDADLHDAFVKAVLEIAAKPGTFDTSRETDVEDFLVGASQRALLPILRTNRRRAKREEKKAEAVAKEHSAARPVVETLADCELAEMSREVAKTDEERSVLRLWESGHTDVEIGKELGMTAEAAGRIRDRVTKRLRRFGQHLSDDE